MTLDYSSFSILHAEDDVSDARIMEYALQKANYDGHYKMVSLGQHVLEVLDTVVIDALPDLIFLDISLPGVNGLELLSEIRKMEHAKNIPVIMLSGSSSRRDYHQAVNLGANAYIQKTSDLKVFINILEHFIAGWVLLTQQQFR